jgi:hypothetical protein
MLFVVHPSITTQAFQVCHANSSVRVPFVRSDVSCSPFSLLLCAQMINCKGVGPNGSDPRLLADLSAFAFASLAFPQVLCSAG